MEILSKILRRESNKQEQFGDQNKTLADKDSDICIIGTTAFYKIPVGPDEEVGSDSVYKTFDDTLYRLVPKNK